MILDRWRAAARCLVCAAFLVASRDIQASPLPVAPDFDADQELQSTFWQNALLPGGGQYASIVGWAHEVLRTGSIEAVRELSPQLQQALVLSPRQPEAMYLLAQTAMRLGNPMDCVTALTQLRDRASCSPSCPDPTQPQQVAIVANDWRLELGRCLAQTGAFEDAIREFQSAQASDGDNGSAAYVDLGAAYMALGRLNDAITTLQAATRTTADEAPWYFLAAALDRAERYVESQQAIVEALNRDHGSASLLDSGHRRYQVFAIPEDRHYILGLAHNATRQWARARHRFRRYLHHANRSPWSAGAQRHLSILRAYPVTGSVETRGVAEPFSSALRATLAQANEQFARCLVETPLLLLRVRLISTDSTRFSSEVWVGEDEGVTADRRGSALACVRRVASSTRWPIQKSSPGTPNPSVTFWLSAP